jgi:hypothetical protein
VRDPAREEQGRVIDIASVEIVGREEVAGVVEYHQHHHQTAQEVDRVQAGAARQRGLPDPE